MITVKAQCSVADCANTSRAKGMCMTHYLRGRDEGKRGGQREGTQSPPLTPCIDCNAPTETKSRRCSACRAANTARLQKAIPIETIREQSRRGAAKRRAQRGNHTPNKEYREVVMNELADAWGWECRYCGKQLAVEETQIDHIMPKNNGGPNRMYNLQLLCLDCHRSKSDRISPANDVSRRHWSN